MTLDDGTPNHSKDPCFNSALRGADVAKKLKDCHRHGVVFSTKLSTPHLLRRHTLGYSRTPVVNESFPAYEGYQICRKISACSEPVWIPNGFLGSSLDSQAVAILLI